MLPVAKPARAPIAVRGFTGGATAAIGFDVVVVDGPAVVLEVVDGRDGADDPGGNGAGDGPPRSAHTTIPRITTSAMPTTTWVRVGRDARGRAPPGGSCGASGGLTRERLVHRGDEPFAERGGREGLRVRADHRPVEAIGVEAAHRAGEGVDLVG